ncbi:MAG: two pore domain potassium channel family protein [Deltaproteobacteria bacterium]|nr:two pore domain potassium channel family protein [Deltaproteobacteria bacterium]
MSVVGTEAAAGASLAVASPDAPAAAPVMTPMEELATLVAWGAAVFYEAEHGHNEKVRDYWDALHYVATSVSVGYADLFPRTMVGKIVGSVVMMVGPALAARALDRPQAPAPADPALLGKLDEVIAELRRTRT